MVRPTSLCRVIAALFAFTLISLAQGSEPTFRTNAFSAEGFAAAQADLNEDGALDLVIANRVYISNGDGTYRAPYSTDTFGWDPVASGDFNGDGNADIAWGAGGSSTIFISHGNGDGTLRARVAVSGPSLEGTYRAVAADFNRDGRMDLALLTQNIDDHHVRLWILRNLSTGFVVAGPFADEEAFENPEDGQKYTWRIVDLLLGDFDADAKADVAYLLHFNSLDVGPGPDRMRLVATYGDGAGGFQLQNILKNNAGSQWATAVGDVNKDGRSDLALARHAAGIEVFYGSSSRTFTQRTQPAPEVVSYPYPSVIADFNGDGRQDFGFPACCWDDDALTELPYGFQVATQNPDGSFTVQQPYALGEFHSQKHVRPLNFLLAGDYDKNRKPDVATVSHADSSGENKLFVALNETSSSGFPKCSHPGARGINVCSPGASSTSPVNFSIGTSSFTPVRKVEIWVDGQKKKETFMSHSHYSYLDESIVLPAGSHNVSVYAAGYDNQLQKKSFTFTVGSGGDCAAPSATTVTICSPENGATVTSPVHAVAQAGASVNWLDVWADGGKIYSRKGNRMDEHFSFGPGTHTMTVFAIGFDGQPKDRKDVTFTVSGSGGGCAAPSATTVTICSPQNGATVASPVHAVAQGGSSVNWLDVWADGGKIYSRKGNRMDEHFSFGPGAHTMTVFAIGFDGQPKDRKDVTFNVQ